MWILDQSESFIFRVDEIELGKIRNYYFIVFFQVEISDTSEYSTWNLKIEKNGKSQSEKRIIFVQSESFILKSGIKFGLSKWDYTWTFPTRNSRFSKIIDLELKNKESGESQSESRFSKIKNWPIRIKTTNKKQEFKNPGFWLARIENYVIDM